MSINRFKGGEPKKFSDRWQCFLSGQMPKRDLEQLMREDDDFRAFVEIKRLEGKVNDFIEGGSDWKARNNARMNERFDDPWGGM